MKKIMSYLALFTILALGVATVRNVKKIFEVKRIAQAEQDRLKKVEEENNKLKDQLSLMQSATYEEKVIRDRLGLIREGETVIVLPEAEILKKLSPLGQKQEEIKAEPTWRKWVKLFI